MSKSMPSMSGAISEGLQTGLSITHTIKIDRHVSSDGWKTSKRDSDFKYCIYSHSFQKLARRFKKRETAYARYEGLGRLRDKSQDKLHSSRLFSTINRIVGLFTIVIKFVKSGSLPTSKSLKLFHAALNQASEEVQGRSCKWGCCFVSGARRPHLYVS